jgi:mannose-6-phosphate isomerase-like protein (cupin superfamily)
MRTILLVIVLLGIGGTAGLIAVVDAQDPQQLPATYTSIAEIEAALDEQGESGGGGASVHISEPDDFAPEVLVRRRFASQPNNASVHEDRDEIYQIIGGGGTFVSGGTFVDLEDRPAGIRGGEARQIGVGDFVVIPAGTLHWFSRINGSITYVNIRLAPQD